jgi:hypothetical protein
MGSVRPKKSGRVSRDGAFTSRRGRREGEHQRLWPSPPWGRGCTAAGVFTSRSGTGEGSVARRTDFAPHWQAVQRSTRPIEHYLLPVPHSLFPVPYSEPDPRLADYSSRYWRTIASVWPTIQELVGVGQPYALPGLIAGGKDCVLNRRRRATRQGWSHFRWGSPARQKDDCGPRVDPRATLNSL